MSPETGPRGAYFVPQIPGSAIQDVVMFTKVDDPSWLDENRAEGKQFLSVTFPGVDTEDPGMEESNAEMRQESPERLEKQLKETIQDWPWVEPDIFKTGDAEIKPCIFGTRSVAQFDLVNLADDGFTPDYAVSSIMTPINVTPTNKAKIFRDKSWKIFRIREKMENMGKKVKFYRRQCEYLLQRSLGASEEILDLFRGTGINWDRYCSTPLINSLDRLVCCMEAGMELLQLCGNNKEAQEVALTLSSPAPYRDSFSKFALVLRDLDWSLDVFRFFMYNPVAGEATASEQQYWLSNFWWCKGRCRLASYGENSVADADRINSCLADDADRQARDRQDLISSLDSRLRRSWSFQTRKSKSEIVSYTSFLANRLQGDSSFIHDSNRVPGCFWISEKLDLYKIIINHIGRGSSKTVYECKWLGMIVAIASFDGLEESSRIAFEAEAGLLARVQHPNVVTFFGYRYDEEKQQGFIVTERMEEDLRTLIRKNTSNHHPSRAPFTLPVSIDIMLQIAEAMVHVHECGVIHRDLKALNCLVNRKSNGGEGYIVKLIDFGESKLRSSEMGSNFRTRNKGSRAWMAPEVYGKEGDEIKEYTWSADVYSFGMTCYEILTGNTPFHTTYSRQKLKEMVCAGQRPEIPPECPKDLVELVTKCWAQSPEARPTFEDIRQILWNCKLHYTIWET